MQPVKGILLDVDGVLHVGIQPIAGATETLDWLTRQGYTCAFVTNTTTLARRLQGIGLPVGEENN